MGGPIRRSAIDHSPCGVFPMTDVFCRVIAIWRLSAQGLTATGRRRRRIDSSSRQVSVGAECRDAG